MAAETAILFAHASGRVLVLPPKAKWYLLNLNDKDDENESTFQTFFDLRKLAESLTVITMEEFLETVALPGYLKHLPSLTDGQPIKNLAKNHDNLWQYLEKACHVLPWEPGKMFIGFNLSQFFVSNGTKLVQFNSISTTDSRIKSFAAHGRSLLKYDEEFHKHKAGIVTVKFKMNLIMNFPFL
jgi:hypothetical protein